MQPSVRQKEVTKLSESRAAGIVTTAEYRKLSGDAHSTDESIHERIAFLENFCRAVIQHELQIHVEDT